VTVGWRNLEIRLFFYATALMWEDTKGEACQAFLHGSRQICP